MNRDEAYITDEKLTYLLHDESKSGLFAILGYGDHNVEDLRRGLLVISGRNHLPNVLQLSTAPNTLSLDILTHHHTACFIFAPCGSSATARPRCAL